jgi:two-component system CheB/CheR fusion protein
MPNGNAMANKKASSKRKTPSVAAIPASTGAQAQSAPGFAIVGLGASAGGLEAFEQFFRGMPADDGMAFVLVPHLDPGHASILSEILQRSTAMPVVEAQDQMIVAPDKVYIIPPNRDMAIFHSVLQLSVPEAPRGQRMPIDAFLRSLAEDQGDKAIGIILSGTGTDGTQGLRAILGAGGITLVQEPATAKYDGMPVSAIQAGYATHVLPVEKMPQALRASVRHVWGRTPGAAAPPPLIAAGSGLSRILLQLRASTGSDFSLYKKSTIGRRIERRMALHDIEDSDTYSRYLQEHPAEVKALFKEMLINVTSFFRDAEAFGMLKNDILPQLLSGKPEGYVFRAWVAGCASGEEAYSIAMLLRELMDEARQEFKVQLYATDLDDEAIEAARAGVYPPNIAQDVTPERLRRFFVKDSTNDSGYRVKKEIREMVVFAVQNVIKDPPFTRLDLLSCRNLLIYLEPQLQNRLIPVFHYALRPGGVLFLSPSESIGNHTDLFAALNRKSKFYRAVPTAASARALLGGGPGWAAEKAGRRPEETMSKTREIDFAELARRMLLQSYAPASVLADLKGNLLYVYGETGKYLRPAPGQATLNVVDMAREGLRLELSAAVDLAAGTGAPTLNRELAVKTGEDFQRIGFSVRRIPDTGVGEGLLLVSFHEPAAAAPEPATAAPSRGKKRGATGEAKRIEALERELAYTKENLRATIEEQQASNE